MKSPTYLRRRFSFIFCAFFALMLILSSCKKYEPAEDTANYIPTNATRLYGTIRDANGAPVEGALVMFGSSTTTTAGSGYYVFNNVACGERCFVRCSKNGFFNGSQGVISQLGGSTQADIMLLANSTDFSVSSNADQNLFLTDGSGFVLPANSVTNADGTTYSGTVHVAIEHLDPTAENFAATTPGGDLIGVDGSGTTRQLLSFGMLMVEMTDNSGNPLQITSGQSANITMPVPASMLGSAPATIPLWHFDENTGFWIEEGTATLAGNNYVGSVSHFSSWNCDYPGSRATVRGRVLDCNNNPVEGLSVTVGQSHATTNSQGYYERYVPSETDFTIQVNQPLNGLVSEVINVSALSADQEYNQVDLHIACPAYVVVSITCNSGSPLVGFAAVDWGSGAANVTINGAGIYKIVVPPSGVSAEVKVVGSNTGVIQQTTVTLPTTTAQSLEAGTFDLCGNGGSEGGLVSGFTINGDGYNNQTFTVTALPVLSYGTYSSVDNSTIIIAGQSDPSLSIGGYFDGTSAGLQNSTDNNIGLGLGINDMSYAADEDLVINVTQYEGVGGSIKGTFSGTFLRYDGTNLITVTVTNGYFNLIRNPDQD
jgi:hypothetical protein